MTSKPKYELIDSNLPIRFSVDVINSNTEKTMHDVDSLEKRISRLELDLSEALSGLRDSFSIIANQIFELQLRVADLTEQLNPEDTEEAEALRQEQISILVRGSK